MLDGIRKKGNSVSRVGNLRAKQRECMESSILIGFKSLGVCCGNIWNRDMIHAQQKTCRSGGGGDTRLIW